MSTAWAVLGSLGGIVAFIVAVVTVIKGIFSQIQATKDLTKAVRELRDVVGSLDGKVDIHAERLSRLEGIVLKGVTT